MKAAASTSAQNSVAEINKTRDQASEVTTPDKDYLQDAKTPQAVPEQTVLGRPQ